MKKYRFTVKNTDGTTKDFDFDDYFVAMRKQAEFVKKAKKNSQIDEVGGVKSINESKKQVVKLNESQLKHIIKECVSKIIKEGGNLYTTMPDGTKFTNSKETYRGVPGTTFIWHGEWSDPEVWYNGKELGNVEDTLWDMYKTECEEEGKEPSEEEFDNLPTEWFQNNLDDIVFGMAEDTIQESVTKAVKKVLKEDYDGLSNNARNLYLMLENNDGKWYNWLQNALIKKARRGEELSVEQLANSIVVKNKVREYAKESMANGYTETPITMEERKEAALEFSARMIQSVKECVEFEARNKH